MKKRGFISHIHEEAPVAEYIKEFTNDIFRGELDLFVSTVDVSAGEWLEQIKNSLQAASFLFPLLSYASRNRPWINFESGVAFKEDTIQLIPLCHGGLTPLDLHPPFSHFQSYDLLDPKQVNSLIKILSIGLNLATPRVDYQEFCQKMVQLDGLVYHFYTSFEDLKTAKELSTTLRSKASPIPIEIKEIDLWDELELRARIYDHTIVELNGHTRESTGFSIYDIDVPIHSTYLLVKLSNTDACISNDKNRMLVVAINSQRILTAVIDHRHYADNQYIVKGDGIFAFELPELVKRSNKISAVHFSFWKIDIKGLLMEFYLI